MVVNGKSIGIKVREGYYEKGKSIRGNVSEQGKQKLAYEPIIARGGNPQSYKGPPHKIAEGTER